MIWYWDHESSLRRKYYRPPRFYSEIEEPYYANSVFLDHVILIPDEPAAIMREGIEQWLKLNGTGM